MGRFDNQFSFSPMRPSGFSPRVQLPSFEPQISEYEVPEEDDGYTSLIQRLKSAYGAPSPALERYRNFSQNVPQRQDPTWKDRLASVLLGFSAGYDNPSAGAQVAMDRMELPYRRALEQFALQRELLGDEAEIERYDRQNQLKALEAEMEAYKIQDASMRDWANTESQIGRRSYQNRYDEARIGDIGADNSRADRQFGLNEELGRGNLRVQQRYAGTGEMNAQTSRMNAGTNRDRLNETRRSNRVGERNDMFRIGAQMFNGMQPNSSDFVQPSQQRTAQELAMQELMMDPEWSDIAGDYIDFTGDFPKLKMDGQMDPDFYQEFLARTSKFNNMRRR